MLAYNVARQAAEIRGMKKVILHLGEESCDERAAQKALPGLLGGFSCSADTPILCQGLLVELLCTDCPTG